MAKKKTDAEKQAAAEQKAANKKAKAEKKAADKQAKADKKAADEKEAADEKAAAEKKAAGLDVSSTAEDELFDPNFLADADDGLLDDADDGLAGVYCSAACQVQLDYIKDAAQSVVGIIQVPVTDETLIAEIRDYCPPNYLRRCCFAAPTSRGSVG